MQLATSLPPWARALVHADTTEIKTLRCKLSNQQQQQQNISVTGVAEPFHLYATPVPTLTQLLSFGKHE
jgi:hypothetical protein